MTNHGQTIGYFIPTQGHEDTNIAALKKESKTFDHLLAEQSVDVEEVVTDFKTVRRQANAPKKPTVMAT